jgi:4-hydroxybutyrate CoA-transferase
VSAEAAMRLIGPGAFVYIGGNAATPHVLVEALARRAAEVEGLTVGHVLMLGADPFAGNPHVRHRAFFVGPADRDSVNAGTSDYVPCHLSEIPAVLRRGPELDAVLLMVSPPDSHGYVSLGVEVLASLAAAHLARTIILQLNPRMPRVQGNAYLHVTDAHAFVEAEEELAELEVPLAQPIERRIAANIVPLIPPEATLQLGIGGIPNAVIGLLEGRSDIGVHSEMISDGVMKAVESGTITGRYKTKHPEKVITSFILGTRALYDWVHDNPGVEAYPIDYTNDLWHASANRRLVAVNSAISVDLTGQVNSDSIGMSVYSGVGGQVDFIRAAARSEGGVPIIALPSTTKKGTVSRIAPFLAEGAGVVTSRASVRYVVTEHGVADLWGKSLRERAHALVGVADPVHWDELMEAAKRRRLW